jgi:hypothetical protein
MGVDAGSKHLGLIKPAIFVPFDECQLCNIINNPKPAASISCE